MHQDPDVPNYGKRGRGPAGAGHVRLAIEPMLTLGGDSTVTLDDDWTVATRDRSRAAHWENTVAITRNGLWVLTAEDGGAVLKLDGARRQVRAAGRLTVVGRAYRDLAQRGVR